MNRIHAKMRLFVEGLIAYETKGNPSSGTQAPGDFLAIIDKLRPNLSTLMGEVGFRSLLSRALVLANAEVPWLHAIHVKADGSLEGLDELAAQIGPDRLFEGRVVLISRLLGLMVTFIGEHLTLRFVREVWPKVPVYDLEFDEGESK